MAETTQNEEIGPGPEEYEALMARVSVVEQKLAVLGNINEAGAPHTPPTAEDSAQNDNGGGGGEDQVSEPTTSWQEKAKAKVKEHYKVQAAAVAVTTASIDLLSNFQLHTAAFIALVSLLLKLAFAVVFTKFHTANCIPSRTILDGDWGNKTYTDLFNDGNRQHLCNSFYLNDFQFAVGNQQFRENFDQLFGFQTADVDLSKWEYDFVWSGWDGVLKANATGLRININDVPNATDFNETMWVLMDEMDQEAHYVGGCAEQCAQWGTAAGFHAHNALTKDWDCMCANAETVDDLLENFCFASYTDGSSSIASECFVESSSSNNETYLEESYYVWNDTHYHVQPFVFFSKAADVVLNRCSEDQLEDLCAAEEDQGSPQKGAPSKRRGSILVRIQTTRMVPIGMDAHWVVSRAMTTSTRNAKNTGLSAVKNLSMEMKCPVRDWCLSPTSPARLPRLF